MSAKENEIDKITKFINKELKHHYPKIKNFNITCLFINDEHINNGTCERKILLYTNDYLENPLEYDKDSLKFSGNLFGIYDYEYYDNTIFNNKKKHNKKTFHIEVFNLDQYEAKNFFKTIERIINWIPFSGHGLTIESDNE